MITIYCEHGKLTLTNEQTKQARSPRKSFGIVSNDILNFVFYNENWFATKNKFVC